MRSPCALLLLLWPALAGAQSQVQVVDPLGSPIPYAQVAVNREASIPTDTAGLVRLRTALAAGVRVRVQRIGFTPLDTVLQAPLADVVRLPLQPLARELGAVRVEAERDTPLARTGFYERMRRVRLGAVRGEFITPEELESRTTGLLATVFQGRQLVTVGRTRPLMLHGRGGCQMDVLVDGRPLREGFLDEFMSANEIMGVEIYGSTANAPAELIPLTSRGSCGIVAVWTGPRR